LGHGFSSLKLAAVLTYLRAALDLHRRFPLKAPPAVNVGFTGIRQVNRRREGIAMSTQQIICANERTAEHAGSAASLILATLLLLIRP